ncbi:MAG: transposase [Deinococcota bacterium]|nr:transposase [Deinococcota bacterium]
MTIGALPHPATHTAAALDGNGRVLGNLTVSHSKKGLQKLRAWAEAFEERQWAIEGVGNSYIYPFVAALLVQDEQIYAISPNLTSQYRTRGNEMKSDEVDAANAARALLANPNLTPYRPSTCQKKAQELTRHYQRLREQLKANEMASKEVDKALTASLQSAIAGLKKALAMLEKQLQALTQEYAAPLLAERGVGPVVTSFLLAEVGSPERFSSRDAFALYAGCAPLSKSSGKTARVQVNYKGNRRLNYAIHIVALSRMRTDERTKTFLKRKKSEGHTQREAMRCLKTYIARELFGKLKQLDLPPLVASYPDGA